jgi:hypothetical protein
MIGSNRTSTTAIAATARTESAAAHAFAARWSSRAPEPRAGTLLRADEVAGRDWAGDSATLSAAAAVAIRRSRRRWIDFNCFGNPWTSAGESGERPFRRSAAGEGVEEPIWPRRGLSEELLCVGWPKLRWREGWGYCYERFYR